MESGMSRGWKGPQEGKKPTQVHFLHQAGHMPDQLFSNEWFLPLPAQHHDCNAPLNVIFNMLKSPPPLTWHFIVYAWLYFILVRSRGIWQLA